VLAGKLDISIDHMIDSLARAISYANSSSNAAKYADLKVSWMAALRPFYQCRHDGSDAGLNDLIANVASKLPKSRLDVIYLESGRARQRFIDRLLGHGYSTHVIRCYDMDIQTLLM
jgi:hypothetical protein